MCESYYWWTYGRSWVKIIISAAFWFNEDNSFISILKSELAVLLQRSSQDQCDYFCEKVPLNLKKMPGLSPKQFSLYYLELFRA